MRPNRSALALGVLLAATIAPALVRAGGDDGSPAKIVFHGEPGEPGFGTVSVEGLPPEVLGVLSTLAPDAPEWAGIFAVRTDPAGESVDGYPPVLGRYAVADGVLRFMPRFPLKAGLSYRARFDGIAVTAMAGSRIPGSVAVITTSFSMPEARDAPSTIVEAVYPTASVLPANLLRLYIVFSSPMRAKGAPSHVHLFDDKGDEVRLPFVEVKEGLWDPAQTRLTLFFHPGRLKRGVAPNEAMGLPLAPGHGYRLVVDAKMRDQKGQSIVRAYEKRFRAAEPDRRSPDPAAWRLIEPGSRQDPVLLDFGEPLDRGLLARMITVWDSEGWPLDGEVTISGAETRWSFHPGRAWQPGAYAIHVDRSLEDLAGNTVDRLFDEQASGEPPAAAKAEPIVIPFTIRR